MRYANVPAINDKIVGYQTMVLIHCNQIVKNAMVSPKACRTQLYTPPSSSGHVDESSADTRATGMRKTIAEKIKKKIKDEPNNAVVGKLRMLSIAPVMSRTKAKTDIFSDDHAFIVG